MEKEPLSDDIIVSAQSADPVPAEVFYTSKWQKIIPLALAIVCALLAILTVNVPLEFDWLFNSCSYDQGFIVLCVLFLFCFASSFGEQRKDPKVYLSSDGKLDISTPRIYQALKVPAVTRFIGRSHSFKGETIETFLYKDGIVSITTNKGNSISAPLAELTWKYSMTKPKGADEWSIYKYTLTDASGNKIVFYLNNAVLLDLEWDDINMLLSLCGTVDESKHTKLNKKMTKVLEVVKDFDFSDIVGSAVSSAGDIVYQEKSNTIIDMVKIKIYGKEKKNTLWDKIKEKALIVIVILYALIVLGLNIFNLVDYLTSKNADDKDDKVVAEAAQVDDVVYVEPVEAESYGEIERDDYVMDGSIDGKYDIVMNICPEDMSGWYYYVKNGPENPIYFNIVNGDINNFTIEEYGDGNRKTGIFKGELIFSNLFIRYVGTFTNTSTGKRMPFEVSGGTEDLIEMYNMFCE